MHPHDWAQALSALPLETPPSGGWQRLSAHLPAPRTRSRWLPASAAAALLAAVALPWLWRDEPAMAPIGVATAPAASAPATPSLSTAIDEAPGVAIDLPPVDATRERVRAMPARVASIRASNSPKRSPAQADEAGADALQALYAESALLENLLAQAQDSGVASGPALVMAGNLYDRIGGIDAALSSASLDADARRSLWSRRVEALRQLAGIESSQRWMAAHGEPDDASHFY